MSVTPRPSTPTDRDQRVLIVWAHRDRRWSNEQVDRYKQTVADFALLLDSVKGLEVEADLFHYDDPAVDFTRWGPEKVGWADTVIMVSSDALWERWSGRNPPHEGAGAVRECDALHGLFDIDQAAFQEKVLIVVLPGGTDDSVPDDLRRIQRRTVTTMTLQGVELVLRRVMRRPRYLRHTDKTEVDLPPYTSQPAKPENEPPTAIQGMPLRRAQHLAAERARHRSEDGDG